MDGWFKMHRKIVESAVFENPDALKMWIWMLSRAAHRKHNQMVGNQNIGINAGEFIFGRRAAAAALNMSESKIYRLLKMIEGNGMIQVQPNNKFSVITIVNWGVYQGNEQEQRTANEQQMNNKRTTSEQQTNTNKNVKNNKECKERKENSPAGALSSFGAPLPPGMTMEEFEQRYREMTT